MSALATPVLRRYSLWMQMLMYHYFRSLHRCRWLAAAGLLVMLGVCHAHGGPVAAAQSLRGTATEQSAGGEQSAIAGMALHTRKNHIEAADGRGVLLRGVNVTSMENTDQWPHLRELLERAIGQWHCNFIRLPLNQDRWLGRASDEKDHGLAYRMDVARAVRMCARHKVYISLDLRWTDRGVWGGRAVQAYMPDTHSLIFWRDVAAEYKKFPNVLFGLFSEPHDVDWLVWRNGGTCMEPQGKHLLTYHAVGMQSLYDAVRSSGAKNIVIVSGIDWASNLFGVLHGFAIKGVNVAYDIHLMGNQAKDWDRRFLLVGGQYPLVVGEWGGYGMPLALSERLLKVLDKRQLNWAAWCLGDDTLIKKQKSSWVLTPLGRLVVSALGSGGPAISGGLKHE